MTGPDIRFVDLDTEHETHRRDIDTAIAAVIDSGAFILGPEVERFERNFATYCTTGHAVGVDSGFSALELLLLAHGIGAGDEVITSANTFHSTVRAIEATGATPVLVDAEPRYRNIDPEAIAAAVTPATRAVLPVHLYGHPADMAAIGSVAADHDLVVLEDACQAHGARCHGRRAGSLGDGAAFSFYPAKNLGALGDGGMAVTDHDTVDHRLRLLRNLGSEVKYHHEISGFNRRLDTIHAAVLDVKLGHLDDANRARRLVAERYRDALAGVPGLGLPAEADWAEAVYHLYVVETADRTALAEDLAAAGIPTGIHYPVPIHLQPAFAHLGHAAGAFPVAEALADTVLSLPMHPYLSEDQVARVAEVVSGSLTGRGALSASHG